MKPEEWEWHIEDGKCLPMQTDKPAAPAELLDIICYSCKKETVQHKEVDMSTTWPAMQWCVYRKQRYKL